MSDTRVELYRDKAGDWRWRAKGDNGEIVGDSGEGYERQIDCVRELRKLFPNADLQVTGKAE